MALKTCFRAIYAFLGCEQDIHIFYYYCKKAKFPIPQCKNSICNNSGSTENTAVTFAYQRLFSHGGSNGVTAIFVT